MNTGTGRTPPRSPIAETTVEAGESTGEVVITGVAAVSDKPVATLPPLYETLDPDALDTLFPDSAIAGNVTFTYDDFLVVVTASGNVQVYDESSS